MAYPFYKKSNIGLQHTTRTEQKTILKVSSLWNKIFLNHLGSSGTQFLSIGNTFDHKIIHVIERNKG